MSPPLVVIIGPTASGKTELAIQLALRLVRAHVVNGDSMLVYKGMDIGTAKPTLAERRGITHHLIDIAEVTHSANVAEFQALARTCIANLREQAITPILCGGSSLYVRAIIDDFDFPGTDPLVRARWEQELQRIGADALHAELARRVPQAAAAILPGNTRRVVRALEIHELTGRSAGKLPEPRYALENVHQFGLRLERDELDRRITQRVHRMWEAGLVDEVRGLLAKGIREGVTASRGLGYQQVLAMLDGQLSEQEAITATIEATKRFARKQLSWFRRDQRIQWLTADQPANVDTIATALGCAGH